MATIALGRHDRCDLREQAPTEPMSELRQASSLVIFEAQAPPREPVLQESILFAEEPGQICLLTMKPATERRDQQLKREHPRSLRRLQLIDSWDTTRSMIAPSSITIRIWLSFL